MWTHIAHIITHWPWANIAAFSAVVVALVVAQADTRERRQLLGREAIAEIAAAAISWELAGTTFLATARRAVNGRAPHAEVSGEAYNLLSAAYSSTVRVFTSAKLSCHDRQLLDSIREAEKNLTAFMAALKLPASDSPDKEEERINRIIEKGDKALRDFLVPIDAVVNRGYDLYSTRPSRRFRIAQWRRNDGATRTNTAQSPAGD